MTGAAEVPRPDGLAAVRDVLHAAGITAAASVVGRESEIVAVRGGPDLCEPLARLAPEIRALGFRYVAWEPDEAYYEIEDS